MKVHEIQGVKTFWFKATSAFGSLFFAWKYLQNYRSNKTPLDSYACTNYSRVNRTKLKRSLKCKKYIQTWCHFLGKRTACAQSYKNCHQKHFFFYPTSWNLEALWSQNVSRITHRCKTNPMICAKEGPQLLSAQTLDRTKGCRTRYFLLAPIY